MESDAKRYSNCLHKFDYTADIIECARCGMMKSKSKWDKWHRWGFGTTIHELVDMINDFREIRKANKK